MKALSQKIKFLRIAFILAIQAGYLTAQISPGDLSNAHAHLEGIKNCTQCHVLGSKETTSKCLDCHKEIQQLININKGYHASKEAKGKKCTQCHGEHFGRNFDIASFDEDLFNHDIAGYKLEGKHSKINCADCHKPALIEKNISQKKNGITFLGLGTECLSCHEDFHQSTLSGSCVSCHNQNAFRPAPGFDHNNTAFPLIGKHQTTDCKGCHNIISRNGKEFQQFTGITSASCTDCHEDVHDNKFGNNCKKCHNEFSFNQVNNLASFNHNKTDFPLKGKHREVECKSCHRGNFTKPLSHGKCTDCHSDYHKKQFAVNGVSPDCKECHTVDNFSPSLFSIERHNNTSFPLGGAHLATPCFSCHKTNEQWNFVFSGTRCIDCHENIHKNYLDEKFMPTSDCRNCHSAETWKSIEFDHQVTNFVLEGKHSQIACSDCHFSEAEDGDRTQQFANLNQACESCHDDAHFNQFAIENKTRCERCHTPQNWNPDKFDHDSARFKLEGEHAGLDCIECHKPTDGLIQDYIVYKFNDISCASCH